MPTLALIFTIASALRPGGIGDPQDAPDYQFAIVLESGGYVCGEAAVATLTLRAPEKSTDQPIFKDNEDFASADITFEVLSNSGDLLLAEPIPGPGVKRLHLTLPPRTDREGPAQWRCDKMFLPRDQSRGQWKDARWLAPGDYRLRARMLLPLPDKAKTLTSETITLTMRPPTPQEEKASQILLAPGIPAFFSGVRGGIPPTIETLLRDYPDTVQADVARTRRFLDRTKQAWDTKCADLSPAEKDELRRLVAEAEQHVAKHPASVLADNLLLTCGRLHKALKDENKAKAAFRSLLEKYPDSDCRELAQKQMPP